MLGKRKGAAPVIYVIFVIFIFMSLDILDKDQIVRREFRGAIDEKSSYSVLHTAELFERTIETGIKFSGIKVLYEGEDLDLEWSMTSPTNDEIATALSEKILIDLRIMDEKIENISIGIVSETLNVIYTDEQVVLKGEIPFATGFRTQNFQAKADSPGKFRQVIETRFFRVAQLVRENMLCPPPESKTIIDNGNEYQLEVQDLGASRYQVTVSDLGDLSPIKEGNLQISVELDCN